MLKKHARYAKYYYTETIWILRCICTVCGVTHAVIPEFSLPGTTIGTEEAETYIKRREQGLGRQRASQVFSGEKAMSVNHPAALDRAFRVAVDRSKAIFSEKADIRLSGCAWIEALTGSKERPMVSLNQYCLEHRVNGICLTRFSIHLFPEHTARSRVPHDNGFRHRFKLIIDSW